MLLNGGTCELDCAHQASEWTNDMWASQVALESAAARVCREAGARVSTNVMMRDMDLLPLDRPDTRRLEVVADGLPLHHGAQLAIDTTMVSPLRRNGAPRPRSTTVDGASLETARARKERRHPELSGQKEGPVLLSSLAKLEDGGPRKHGISCDTWPKQQLVGNLSFSNEERRLRG